MYICQKCGRQSQPGEKPIRVVVEVREKIYERRSKVQDDGFGGKCDDPGGRGTEIVKELVACDTCAAFTPPV